ncbi:beta-ketoacyl synthase N-terminal-like domain-containing protein [Dyadobacter sp. CY323]|uniref:beta-ketoacyl synthase N-terminal-like domain-containing protein n=1 Tax=Dyadobacter sp. CY323 TaxID=2907302 RepID=UPI001F480A64|nr:beta-ketoacyl synthase N-terminal-like domain-containing protein [Dyadobacter sp. CY323]MCE6991337.1 beta-ketoacyl synthase [Dyadobacter sp. CY323]
MTYIGAEVIISPLGSTASDNWNALSANRSGITLAEKAGYNQEDIYLSQIAGISVDKRFEYLVGKALTSVEKHIDGDVIRSERTIVILSSTKGALDTDVTDQFGSCVTNLIAGFHLANAPLVISNACISGVLAINAAGNFINEKLYDHAIVIGCDVISKFVLYGFQSLFAISDKPCTPFDAARNGITLGEGCGVVVVSSERNIYKKTPLKLLAGTSANDANHISGPSRTGEGLVRSVTKTLQNNKIDPSEIDFISAHGTATVFNDEMEAIAFDRTGLSQVPMNSFKGYFGHTLGAAGVIETAASMQMIRNEMLVKSLGCSQSGTSKSVNIIAENRKASLKTVLKTASGFGGGNASLIIRNL